jgi:hypothetical protein
VYRRQRRTIQPQRHHCGVCRGSLQELRAVARSTVPLKCPSTPDGRRLLSPCLQPVQLFFTF